MAYASTCHVANLVRNRLGEHVDFSENSSPTDVAVITWLSSGCAVINTRLAVKGYGPIPESSQAYDLAQQVNALFAAWMVERSMTLSTVSRDENTRADLFKRDYTDLLKELTGMNLALLGVPKSANAAVAPYAGGISVDDKSTVASDSDRVEPRFKRGMMRDPNAPGI